MPKRSFAENTEVAELRRIALDRIATRLRELLAPGEIDAAAVETGLNRSTLYKWRSGQQQPGVVDLLMLAQFLGVSLSDLVGDVAPQRERSPYDRHHSVRDLIDALDVAPTDTKLSFEQIFSMLARVSRDFGTAKHDENVAAPAESPRPSRRHDVEQGVANRPAPPHLPRALETFGVDVPYTDAPATVQPVPSEEEQHDVDAGSNRAKKRRMQ